MVPSGLMIMFMICEPVEEAFTRVTVDVYGCSLTVWGVKPDLTSTSRLIRHPGLGAQVDVVCHRTKLGSILHDRRRA